MTDVAAEPILRISRLQKNYGGLRPLRMQSLDVQPRERVALSGLDATAAELFVNLVTGASLPDEGAVITFGRATNDVTDGDTWLASLERFGIVSPRAVLLEGVTLRQNLALPFTLDIDDPPADVGDKVAAVARECGIAETDLGRLVAELPAHVRVRAHLARAVALDPGLLLVEHPTADVTDQERVPLARDLAAAAERYGAAVLLMTMDLDFAEAAAHRLLALEPATGALRPWKRKRRWLG